MAVSTWCSTYAITKKKIQIFYRYFRNTCTVLRLCSRAAGVFSHRFLCGLSISVGGGLLQYLSQVFYLRASSYSAYSVILWLFLFFGSLLILILWFYLF